MSAPVVILAGGTGGHIFPGLAVAEALRRRDVPVLWMGARGRMEERLVPAHGLELECIDIHGIRGLGPLRLPLALLRVLRAVFQAAGILRRAGPRAVISFGGYAAGPGGLAAWLLRKPLLVHEQNSRPGLTNRVLARLARRVLEGFPDSFPRAVRTELVGNPVRAEIAALPGPEQRLTGRDGPVRILILGGSQGARSLNEDLPAALAQAGESITIHHQCGAGHEAAAGGAYARAGLVARVEPFIHDMAAAWAWADLVVCRAGALTLAELCAAGVAAILVPLPSAADDHQTTNADYLVRSGAAARVAEGAGFVARMAVELDRLVADPDLRRARALAARGLARPDAAELVVKAVLAEAGS